ncbi:uncharacterized protein [Nicotiana tomentosiformis]|uniref:uncharacterized protein n=1 Tax=Nicotiana tomentosiformis TaxID=4098 RepID=UPI00388C6DC1
MSALPENCKDQSTTRPPLSNNHYYSLWKERRRYHFQITDGCFKCDKKNHMFKNCPIWEVEWKKESSKRRNRKKEQVHDKKKYNKGPSKAMVDAWEDISDKDIDDDDAERALIAIQESEDEPEEESEISFLGLKDKIKFLFKDRLSELLLTLIDESKNISSEKEQLSKECVHALDTSVLELRSRNLKLKLGAGKEIASGTQLSLEEDLGKVKDELYKRDELVRTLKEDLNKFKHELDRTCKWNREKGEIIGVGKVGKLNYHSIKNVYLIDGLKYSLISISQLCDRGNMVAFTSTKCFVINLTIDKIVLQGKRVNNIYVVDMSTLSDNELTCLSVLDNDPLLWHKRLGHASLSQLNKLVSKDLGIGLPNIKFKEDKVYEDCARGKKVRSSFKSNKMVRTTRTMELVYMDLCGPMKILSRGGKRYVMVLVDYSRFIWTLFLISKDEAFDMFISFVRKTQNQLGNQLASIRSDHGTEFENAKFVEFCGEHGIDHNFYIPRTSQQNGVVE